MLLEELADRRGFVGGEIVENDVNLLPRRAQGYDFLEKGNELAAVSRAAASPWTRPAAVLSASRR
jgi:hypothetical protein